jgi:hypothetical protein
MFVKVPKNGVFTPEGDRTIRKKKEKKERLRLIGW